MRLFFVLLSFLLGFNFCFAQAIQGKVIDERSGEGIPFVSIGIIGNNTTTITNDAGEFVLKNISLPVKLRYSHVSYLMLEETIATSSENQIVKLKAASINLDPVVIGPNRGAMLLQQALELTAKYQNQNFYGNAFYRQLTTINGMANQIYELFYDVELNVSKVKGWIAKQTRFAQSNQDIAFAMNNQSYLTFSLAGSLLEERKNVSVVTLKTLRNFEISVEKYIEQHGQGIAVVSCKYKGNRKSSYVNSVYYIGTNDYKIYRLENSIFNLPMKITESTKILPPIVTTVATFNGNQTPIPIIESISTKLYLNLSANGRKISPVVSSMLSIYRLDNNLNTQKFSELTRNVKDKAIVESIEYNASFWKDNPVVKQTTLEQNFTKMIESKSGFGTMINP
jgi:hypothetical protein